MLGQVVSAVIPPFRERGYISTLLSYLSLEREIISSQYRYLGMRVPYICAPYTDWYLNNNAA